MELVVFLLRCLVSRSLVYPTLADAIILGIQHLQGMASDFGTACHRQVKCIGSKGSLRKPPCSLRR